MPNLTFVTSTMVSSAANSIISVYTCPAGKKVSYIDLTLHKQTAGDSIIDIAIAPSGSTSFSLNNYIAKNVKLAGNVFTSVFKKVIVSPNESVYIVHISGPAVTIRATGVEDVNTSILKSGTLASGLIAANPGGVYTEIYQNNTPSSAYMVGSVVVYNDGTTQDTINMHITSVLNGYNLTNRVFQVVVDPKTYVLVEDVALAPNERIYISTTNSSSYNINGVNVSV